jgi:hypothetical protein
MKRLTYFQSLSPRACPFGQSNLSEELSMCGFHLRTPTDYDTYVRVMARMSTCWRRILCP